MQNKFPGRQILLGALPPPAVALGSPRRKSNEGGCLQRVCSCHKLNMTYFCLFNIMGLFNIIIKIIFLFMIFKIINLIYFYTYFFYNMDLFMFIYFFFVFSSHLSTCIQTFILCRNVNSFSCGCYRYPIIIILLLSITQYFEALTLIHYNFSREKLIFLYFLPAPQRSFSLYSLNLLNEKKF